MPLKTSPKGPKTMLIFGICSLVLAIAGIGLAVLGGTLVGNAQRQLIASAEPDDGGNVTLSGVQLEAGKRYVIASTAPASMVASVSVRTGADGTGPELPLTSATSRLPISIPGDVARMPLAYVTPTQSGAYQIEASYETAVVAGSASIGVVFDASDAQMGTAVMTLVSGMLLALILGPVGLGLTIGGAVWRSRRNRNRRLVESGMAPGAAQ